MIIIGVKTTERSEEGSDEEGEGGETAIGGGLGYPSAIPPTHPHPPHAHLTRTLSITVMTRGS